jgi:hypothetical protein
MLFDLLPSGGWSRVCLCDDGADAEIVQRVVDPFLAVAAAGGHGVWCAAGAGDDPLDGRRQLWGVGGVARLDAVIEHDAVFVFDDLGFVTEFHRPSESALGDWAGIGVVQADLPRRSVGNLAGYPLAGLGDDAAGRIQQRPDPAHRLG